MTSYAGMKITTLHINLLFTALLLACFMSFISCKTQENSLTIAQQNQRFESRVLIIFYDKEIGNAPLLESLSTYDATVVYSYKLLNGMAINIPTDKNILEAIEYFKSIKGVLSVEPDRKLELMNQKSTPTVKIM